MFSWCHTVWLEFFRSHCFTSVSTDNKKLRLNSAQCRLLRTGNGWNKHCALSGLLSLLRLQQLNSGLITLVGVTMLRFTMHPTVCGIILFTHGNYETYQLRRFRHKHGGCSQIGDDHVEKYTVPLAPIHPVMPPH